MLNAIRVIGLCVGSIVTTSVVGNSAMAEDSDVFKPEVYLDGYIGHDYSDPPTRKRSYVTQAFYDDEFALNLGHVGATVQTERVHGRLVGQYGSSVISNYAGEPQDGWRYIQEGYAGVKLADNLWLDAGIFLAHIGAESWISKDNFNYTRSFIAEFSPYYESGARLEWKPTSEFSAQALFLRGWQNISDDRDPGFGTQAKWTPSGTPWTVTHNTFFGRENGGDREFSDLIVGLAATDTLSLLASADVGQQELSAGNGSAWWWGWSVMGKWQVAPTIALGGRVEGYNDPHQAIVATGGPSFKASGISANVDWALADGLLWRNEVRGIFGHDSLFPTGDGGARRADVLVVSSLSFFFS